MVTQDANLSDCYQRVVSHCAISRNLGEIICKKGKIMFYSDNMAVVKIINKQTCKDKV